MATSFYGYAQHLGSSLSHYRTYGYLNQLEIKATPENLQQAIREKGQNVLQCKFKDTHNYYSSTYSALEYAVKCGDIKAVRDLIALGAKVEDSEKSFGTIVHFYMDCLSENTKPDLDMLNLLLDHISDLNMEEAGYFRTSLEYALNHMAHYKNIHWDVIEILLKRGVRITDKYDTGCTPFNILKDSQNHKIQYGHMMRSPDKEKTFLKNLAAYLELEKKYHPESPSCLTLEEFQLHASTIKYGFSMPAIFMSNDNFFSESFASLSKDLEDGSFLESTTAEEREDLEKRLPEIQAMSRKAHFEITQNQLARCLQICKQLLEFHSFFGQLVKEGNFKECFDSWQLASMGPALVKLKDSNHREAKLVLALFDKFLGENQTQ